MELVAVMEMGEVRMIDSLEFMVAYEMSPVLFVERAHTDNYVLLEITNNEFAVVCVGSGLQGVDLRVNKTEELESVKNFEYQDVLEAGNRTIDYKIEITDDFGNGIIHYQVD